MYCKNESLHKGVYFPEFLGKMEDKKRVFPKQLLNERFQSAICDEKFLIALQGFN
jgi:hypothetical protein